MENYPKWIDVDGPGHPLNPGKVLVSNEDEEKEAKSKGTGPANLNPPPDAGQKSLDEMDRDELKQVLLSEGIPEAMTDDDIRDAIKDGRERRAEVAEEDAEKAKEQREKLKAGGDHGDGKQTDETPAASEKPGKDASGDDISPDTADEANKTLSDATRTAPIATSNPATDLRPQEAKDKQADSDPAGNVSEAAATPPKQKSGSSSKPGKVD